MDANDLQIRPATEADVQVLFDLILELAEYEKLADEVAGDAEVLRRSLFEEKAAEALLLEAPDGGPAPEGWPPGGRAVVRPIRHPRSA